MEVIDNRVGEPDTSLIPPNILPGKLPAEVLKLIEYGYSIDRQGLPQTLAAVAGNFNKKHNLTGTKAIKPEQVVMCDGARASATVAIHLLRHKYSAVRERALILHPGYNLYTPQFTDSGFEVDFVDIANLPTKIRLQKIKAALTPETVFLTLNNPNNPTGEIYKEDFLKGLLEILPEFPRLHIINDSVYDEILISGERPLNIFAIANEKQREQIFEVSSLAKSYAYPAIRCGWVISDKITAEQIQAMKDPMLGPLNNIAQLVCISALEYTPANYHENANKIYKARLELIHNCLSVIPDFKPKMPECGFYYWADFSGLKNVSAADIVAELAKEKIYLSGGEKYGAPDFIRINCAVPEAILQKICTAIAKFCGV